MKAELTARATTLGDALRAHLPPGATFTQPTGGYFIWIRLPEGLDGAELLAHCVEHHKASACHWPPARVHCLSITAAGGTHSHARDCD